MAEINVAAAVTESAEITTPILQTIMEFLNSSIAQDGEPVCPCEVLFERMTDKGLSMAIQQSSSGLPNRYDQNIVGSYTVDLPFNVYISISAKASADRIGAIMVLDRIGSFFTAQTKNKTLPMLGDGLKALKIETTGRPVMIDTDENSRECYGAEYTLSYRHLSEYER